VSSTPSRSISPGVWRSSTNTCGPGRSPGGAARLSRTRSARPSTSQRAALRPLRHLAKRREVSGRPIPARSLEAHSCRLGPRLPSHTPVSPGQRRRQPGVAEQAAVDWMDHHYRTSAAPGPQGYQLRRRHAVCGLPTSTASSAMVGARNTSGRRDDHPGCLRDPVASCTAVKECPPRSKKFSCRPMSSMASNSDQIAAAARSLSVHAPPLPSPLAGYATAGSAARSTVPDAVRGSRGSVTRASGTRKSASR
jgi:hypothetical protein